MCFGEVMTNARTIIAAAISIMLGSTACSSTITAKPWRPKKSRSDAAEQAHQDAGDASHDGGDEDDDDSDAGL
jgi:hypothetical protein